MSSEKRRAPAFQFYADDFLAGTLDLSQAEVGAYIRLLCHQWNRGSIPVETEKQQRLAGGSVSVDVLAKFRLVDGSRLVNERLEQERQKQDEFRKLQAEKGRKSVELRKNEPKTNRGLTEPPTAVEPKPQPNTQPEGNSPSPSPLPLPSSTPINPLTPLQGELVPSAGVQNTASAVSTMGDTQKPQDDGKAAKSKRVRKQVEPMIPPTLEEVKLHCAKIGLPETEAYKFHGYYESNGWMTGRNPMRSWVGAMANWKGNYDERRNNTAGGFNRPSNGANGNPRNQGIAGFDEWHRDFQARAARDGQHGPWDDFGREPAVEEEVPETGRVAPSVDGEAGAGG